MDMNIYYRAFVILATAVLWASSAATMQGAGFYLGDAAEDARRLGNAGAGWAAVADDPDTVYFNPAGMTKLTEAESSFSLTTIFLDLRFHNEGSSTAGLFPTSGGNSGNAGAPGQNVLGRLASSSFITLPVTTIFGKQLFAGIGINSPFGLETNYSPTSVERYQATNSRLLTLNVNPSLALRVNSWFSFGLGFDAEYAEVALSKIIDYGLAGAALGIPGFSPGGNDSSVRLAGNDTGYGWNAGVLLEPAFRTRIGLSYRSNIEFQLEGKAAFRDVPPPFNQVFFNQDIEADLNLPAIYSASIYQELNDEFAIVGDITWTEWSSFDKIQIDFSRGITPDTVQFQRYKDVFRYSAGVIYTTPNKRLTLRAGYAYDESPIRNASLRTPGVPDSNRNILACGFTYRPADNVDLNVGYSHAFFADSTITNDDGAGHVLKGSYKASANLVSIGYTYHFGGPKHQTSSLPATEKAYLK
jgi:long-chain fatty acid transport protein